jgi:hypothetical protein
LLPVGLADFIGRRYGGFAKASTGILSASAVEKDEKKSRTFSTARPV